MGAGGIHALRHAFATHALEAHTADLATVQHQLGHQHIGLAPVQWTVNCFRDRHCALSEGGTEIAPTLSIVDPEGTVRSLVPRDRS